MSVVVMPVLAIALGECDAFPALTVASLVGNSLRAWFNRAALCWSATRAHALGGYLFTNAPQRVLSGLMDAFLLGTVISCHVRKPADKPSHEEQARPPVHNPLRN